MTDLRPALLAAALLATPAAHAGTTAYLGVSSGYRHSLTLDAGGLSFGGYLGLGFGRFGIEYQSTFANDRTFRSASLRVAGRNTNFLNLSVSFLNRRGFSLGIAAGPGLGWVRPAGKPSAPDRELSAGVQEFLDFTFGLDDSDDVFAFFSLRVGAQHHWQNAVVPSPEHAIHVNLVVGFGPRF